MARDLCDLFANGSDDDSFYTHDDSFSNTEVLGMALGFGDMIASERESISDMGEDINLFDDYAECTDAIETLHFKVRENRMDVPAFEQHVHRVCGVVR